MTTPTSQLLLTNSYDLEQALATLRAAAVRHASCRDYRPRDLMAAAVTFTVHFAIERAHASITLRSLQRELLARIEVTEDKATLRLEYDLLSMAASHHAANGAVLPRYLMIAAVAFTVQLAIENEHAPDPLRALESELIARIGHAKQDTAAVNHNDEGRDQIIDLRDQLIAKGPLGSLSVADQNLFRDCDIALGAVRCKPETREEARDRLLRAIRTNSRHTLHLTPQPKNNHVQDHPQEQLQPRGLPRQRILRCTGTLEKTGRGSRQDPQRFGAPRQR